MIQIGPLKLRRQLYLMILLSLLALLIIIAGVTLFLVTRSKSAAPLPAVQPSTPGNPVLQDLGLVTDQAFGTEDQNVPDSWGVHKNRIIRLSTGDLFTVYTSAGQDTYNRTWHLMHRAPGGGDWNEVKSGNAGVEPINILRGPNDEINLFAWPGTAAKAQHLSSTDLGKTFKSEYIPGQWAGGVAENNKAQGYSGSGVNAQGDMVFFQSGNDTPGEFLWAYYSHSSQQWQFHITKFDLRYTYAFFFPGPNDDLTIVGMRDVQRDEIGLKAAPPDQFNYVFNAIRYFYIGDVNNPDGSMSTAEAVAPIVPHSVEDYAVTYLTDTYMDTQGRTHI